MKILAFLKTHFIDDSVISEYSKLNSAKNVKTILFIDNHKGFIKSKNNDSPLVTIDFNGLKTDCFLFDTNIFEKMNLPYYTDDYNNKDLGNMMWYNSDYSAYFVKKYCPDYDYYWSIESDVFCNGKSYFEFFEKYKNNNSDLIIKDYRSLKNSPEQWYWDGQSDWIYKDEEKFGSFFPVVRLSSKAIDHLYQKRQEHSKIFEQVKYELNTRWLFCELFVPTELSNSGFKCENLNEPHIRYQPVYNLNKERIFEKPDNRLYHPVK